MALPDTTNTSALFISRRPAWEEGIDLDQTTPGDVVRSRSGLEQRQQRSARCNWKISYKAFLDAAERTARRKRSLAEIRSLCWVPFWTERAITAGTMTTTAVTLDREYTFDFFAPGDWVLFDSPTQGQQFRQVEDHGSTTQQILLVSMGGAIVFNPGTAVYPCRACAREGGLAEFEDAAEATSRETLTYATL